MRESQLIMKMNRNSRLPHHEAYCDFCLIQQYIEIKGVILLYLKTCPMRMSPWLKSSGFQDKAKESAAFVDEEKGMC